MAVELKTNAPDAAAQLRQHLGKASSQVKAAMRATAKDAAEAIKARGVADIAAAGNFGSRWQDALKTAITEDEKTIYITTSMEGGPPVSYWRIFEEGATIFAHNPTGLLTWPNTSAFSVGGTVPLFISKAQVTIPKKFSLHEVIAQVAKELREFYARHIHG